LCSRRTWVNDGHCHLDDPVTDGTILQKLFKVSGALSCLYYNCSPEWLMWPEDSILCFDCVKFQYLIHQNLWT